MNNKFSKIKNKKIKIKNPYKNKTWKEFKIFVSKKGNLLDLAIAFIIGGAFSAIVTSLVNDIIMPVIGKATGKSLSDLIWVVNGQPPYLESGNENPKAIIVKYGNFLQLVINFFIISLILFTTFKIYNSIVNGYKNRFFGYTSKEYFELIKSGKKRKEIRELAFQRDVEKAKKEEEEKLKKEKDSIESILKDIRTILEQQQSQIHHENKPKSQN